jgi:hypothetical protein
MKASRNDPRIAHLENLVDELLTEKPREEFVRREMAAAGLTYSVDPIERMNLVMAALERDFNSSKRSTNGERSRDL